jgi:hypothetical protein
LKIQNKGDYILKIGHREQGIKKNDGGGEFNNDIWCTFWHLQKFLQYINCIILEFTVLPSLFFILQPPIPGIVSTTTIFPFTYMCPQYLHYIYLLKPFSHLLSPPTGTNSLRQDLFCPSVLRFCKRQKMTALFKIATEFFW